MREFIGVVIEFSEVLYRVDGVGYDYETGEEILILVILKGGVKQIKNEVFVKRIVSVDKFYDLLYNNVTDKYINTVDTIKDYKKPYYIINKNGKIEIDMITAIENLKGLELNNEEYILCEEYAQDNLNCFKPGDRLKSLNTINKRLTELKSKIERQLIIETSSNLIK